VREGARIRTALPLSALFASAVLSRAAAGEPSPAFTLSLSPCPGAIEARPGEPWEREIGVILTTADNPDPEVGVQAWILGMTADGCS
jgi:hypothetical protein